MKASCDWASYGPGFNEQIFGVNEQIPQPASTELSRVLPELCCLLRGAFKSPNQRGSPRLFSLVARLRVKASVTRVVVSHLSKSLSKKKSSTNYQITRRRSNLILSLRRRRCAYSRRPYARARSCRASRRASVARMSEAIYPGLPLRAQLCHAKCDGVIDKNRGVASHESYRET
jgi:hypothetical protein